LLLQLLLFFCSVKAYFSMPRNRDDLYLLIPRLGSALLVTASVLVFSVTALTPKRASNEASAVGSLRTIETAQTQFAQDHPQLGFATSLAQLGPTPGAEFIDAVLASGTKSAYTFAITSTTTDSQAQVTKFSATARPVHYDKVTGRSFLRTSLASSATPGRIALQRRKIPHFNSCFEDINFKNFKSPLGSEHRLNPIRMHDYETVVPAKVRNV